MHTHQAKCERCNYRAGLNDTLRTYEFEDGVHLNIKRTFVWCAGCQGVQWGESIPDLEDLEKLLVDLPSSDLERRIAWRRERVSGPRCLECGSTDICPLESSETKSGKLKWMLQQHPGCGGRITVLRVPVLALDRGWITYSPEGT